MNPVPIPDRLKRRPLHGGFPVPFSVAVIDGVPDFKVTDAEKWTACVEGQLCALCGERLTGSCWFVGGPLCKEHELFFDSAMHRECALYALQVCPFLAMKKEYAPLDHAARPREGLAITVDESQHRRPEKFFLFLAYGYALRAVQTNQGVQVLIKAFVRRVFEVPPSTAIPEWSLTLDHGPNEKT